MWMTPKAGDAEFATPRASGRPPEMSTHLGTEVLFSPPQMWPTPTVQDGKNDAGPSQWERNSDPLNVAVQRVGMWATPRTEGHDVGRHRGRADSLHSQVKETQPAGRLNPDFVERLMGFPPGWTDLSATDPA